MKYIKYLIPMFIIFLTIGFAATNVTLSITGDAYIASDLEDFEVYISSIKLDGVEDITLLKSSTEFELVIAEIGEYTIDFEITNSSMKFDAAISISCDNELEGTMNDYTFSFDDSEPLLARSSRSGSFYSDVFEPIITGETISLSCKIEATPIERTEYGEGEVPDAVSPWAVGREITLGPEKFNIISETDTTITMLAQYNLGTNYWQSTTLNNLSFSKSYGWDYTPGPEEIDVQLWSADYIAPYLNNYVAYLTEMTGDSTLSGDLITLSDLKELGCTIQSDYSKTGEETCVNSEYSSWLINGQSWWTKSASSNGAPTHVWYFRYDGILDSGAGTNISNGVRPVITISKDTILNFVQRTLIEFTIGDVTYYAEEGMTWRQWVSSGYSNGDFSIGSCYRDGVGGYCEVDSSGYSVVYTQDLQFGVGNGGSVYVDGTIINGSTYYLENLWMDIGDQP